MGAGLPYQDLLRPVSDDAPSGPSLKQDARYMELLRIGPGTAPMTEMLEPPAFGQPAKTRIIPGKDPDWPLVRDLCIELFARSHDLVIGTWYTVALVQSEGFAGLAEGLGAIRWLLEKDWDTLHPALDQDDRESPAWKRTKVLNRLASAPGKADELRLCQRLRETAIFESRNAGQLSLRMISIAAGQEQPPEDLGRPVDVKLVLEDADTADLSKASEDLDTGLQHLAAIDRVFRGDREQNIPGRVKPGQEPQLGRLRDLLSDARKHVVAELGRRAGLERMDPGSAGEAGGHGGPVSAAGAGLSGEIRTREDVRRALERVVDFYLANEPSSPVWLYAKAASRLIEQPADALVSLKVFEKANWDFLTGLVERPEGVS